MSRTKMLEEYRVWADLTEKEQAWFIENVDKYKNVEEALNAGAKPKKEKGACANVKRVAALQDKLKLLTNPVKSMNDEPGIIAWTEENFLGIPITYAKVDSCDTSRVNTSCIEFSAGKAGYMIFGVTIQSCRVVKIKNGRSAGRMMAFMTIDDGTCALSDVCVFSDVYETHTELLVEGNTVLIRGERDMKKGSLIVKEIWQI